MSKTFIVNQVCIIYASRPEQTLAENKRRGMTEWMNITGPDLGAAVFEELQELWDHDVQGSAQGIAVQQLGRVLADLLQRSERTLQTHKNIQSKLDRYQT